MSTPIEQNTTDLQAILDAVNALPEAGSGGVELPELSNPGNVPVNVFYDSPSRSFWSNSLLNKENKI